MFNVPPTQDGLRNTIANTGRIKKPSNRTLDRSRLWSSSSSIFSAATCLRVARNSANTMDAEKPGVFFAWATWG